MPRLVAAEADIEGWKLRRTLTLYGSRKPASLWTLARAHPASSAGAAPGSTRALTVHEGLIVEGRAGIADRGLLRHERGLPLDEQMRKEIVYAKLKAEQRLARGLKAAPG